MWCVLLSPPTRVLTTPHPAEGQCSEWGGRGAPATWAICFLTWSTVLCSRGTNRLKQTEATQCCKSKQELNNHMYFRSFSYVSWNVPGTSLYSKSSPAFKAMHIRLPLWGRGDTPSVSHKPLRSKQQLKKSVDVHNGKAEARIFLTKNVIFY